MPWETRAQYSRRPPNPETPGRGEARAAYGAVRGRTSNRNSTGNTARPSSVDETMPPITTVASGR